MSHDYRCAFFMYRALLCVIGDVMLDVDLCGTITRRSPEDRSVPVVRCPHPTYHLGGAANVASLATAQGADVVLLGAVADDVHGRQLEAMCTSQHIDAILDHSLTTTTTKYRVFVDGTHSTRTDVEHPKPVESIVPKSAGAANAVVLSDYAKGVFGPQAVDDLQALIRNATCPVVADIKPTPYVEAFTGATVITPNESELAAIAAGLGLEALDTVTLAAAVRERLQLQAVVVTMGAAGALWVGKMAFAFHPLKTNCPRPQVVGAGDAFVVALALALGDGASMDKATRTANTAAHAYVGRQRCS